MAAKALVEEINHCTDPRSVPDAFVREQPQHPAMFSPRRQAANEIGIAVGHNAWQDRDPEARANSRQQPPGRRVTHRDLALEAQRLQPVLIMDPEVAAAAPDERMLPQLCAIGGYAVPCGIVAAAIESPVVDAQLTAHVLLKEMSASPAPRSRTCRLVSSSITIPGWVS